MVPSHYRCRIIVNWIPWKKLQSNCNQVILIFSEENSFENVVCRIWPFWTQGQWINHTHTHKCTYTCLNFDVFIFLTHWGWEEIDTILQTFFKCIFFNENVWISIEISFEFVFLRVQLTIFQQWFRYWLGTDQVTSYYLKQWWHSLLMQICITQPQWVKGGKSSWT